MSVVNKRPLPNLEGLNWQQSVKAIRDYLDTMTEELRYALNNVEPDDNFTAAAYEQYKELTERTGFTGDIPSGATLEVKNGIITGYKEG